MDEKKFAALVSSLMRGWETAIAEVCGAIGVSRSPLYLYMPLDGKTRNDR